MLGCDRADPSIRSVNRGLSQEEGQARGFAILIHHGLSVSVRSRRKGKEPKNVARRERGTTCSFQERHGAQWASAHGGCGGRKQQNQKSWHQTLSRHADTQSVGLYNIARSNPLPTRSRSSLPPSSSPDETVFNTSTLPTCLNIKRRRRSLRSENTSSTARTPASRPLPTSTKRPSSERRE